MDGDAGKRHTYEQAFTALGLRGASFECPVCGRNAWKGVGSLANLLIGLPAATPGELLRVRDPADKPASLVCYVFICGNCGFVRLHSADDLDAVETP